MEIKHKENSIKLALALYRVTECFPQNEPLRSLIRCQAHDFLASSIIVGGAEFFLGDIKKALMDLDLKGELLQASLELAQKQEWVKTENIIFLIAEYEHQRAVLRAESPEYSRGAEGRRPCPKAGPEVPRIPRDPEHRRGTETETMLKSGVKFKTEEIIQRPAVATEKIKVKRAELGKRFKAEGEESNNNRHQRIIEILRHRANVQVKDIKEVFPQLSKRTLRRDFEYLLRVGVVDRIGEGNMTVYKLKVPSTPRG